LIFNHSRPGEIDKNKFYSEVKYYCEEWLQCWVVYSLWHRGGIDTLPHGVW